MKNTFKETYPDAILSCLATYDKQGPEKFYELFGVSWNSCKGYDPLFLALNYSSMGGLAETYGLLTKNGQLYEVYGTECSVYDFLEQWRPEKTTYESILHRIHVGQLGMDKGYNDSSFAYGLKKLVVNLMEKDNLVSYDNCTDVEKYHLYAKSFNEQTLKTNNVLAYNILEDIIFYKAYQYHLKPAYFEQFKALFNENLCFENEYKQIYCFREKESCIFYSLTPSGSFELSFSHPDIYKENFSLFNYSHDMNVISENIVLSLLEKNNLFQRTYEKKLKIQ